ncbi:protein transport protein Sec31B isoform X2 [Hyperolius riggenbachi]|uniref:protein transport protein Sec31B isoform X2 n=1 Tax=Hyperolius riggenbachi TaxID=752182 RepID=UPI0035A35EA3
MKLKEIERSAVQAWSPANQHPVYLATGTSAQQLDASFSTSASLEIFEVDFGDPLSELKRRGVYPASSRFHKIIWGSFDGGSSGSNGVIVGGGDNGEITLYSASQILASGKEPVIGKNGKHTGPVRALDLNPFQNNLLASGANDSEVFIWDLNNFSVPMTPGGKSQPVEDVSAISWNQQVQHILSSAHPSGKAVVWDLRKNEPVIKVSDHSNRMHCSGMLWHPEIATQLILSSEDDRLPVIQVWDLRFASSPLKMLENHTRGILSVSWSKDDPELLLSSSKDNRILCWNPSTSEVVYELPVRNQWCFDVQWCPRNPSVFSAASFDGWLSVYSVMGGSLEAQQKSQADKISSSFNNLDPFGIGQSLPPLEVPQQTTQTTVIPPLKKPPRWIRRPVGVSFAFGGKLVSFDCPKANVQPAQDIPHQVYISQVTTEREFLTRSSELQVALLSGNLQSYCQSKVQNSSHAFEKNIWNFLKVNFEQDAREKFLKLLGYNKDELDKKISVALGDGWQNKNSPSDGEDLVQSIQSVSSQASSSFTAQTSSSSSMEFFNQDAAKFEIPVSSDTDGLISQALLMGNFEAAVELCLKDGRYADAIILANAGGETLLRETQQWYFTRQKSKITSLLSSVVQHKWKDVVLRCHLQNWKEALALLLTYSKPEEYAELCDTLGNRLEAEGDRRLSAQACLCYISSGNVDRLAECWVRTHETSTPLALQDLVEKTMILRKSIELLRGTTLSTQGPVLVEKLAQYASLLASQGNLTAAMGYLPEDSEESSVHELRDRLLSAQGQAVNGQSSASKLPSTYPSPSAKPSKAPDIPTYRDPSIQGLSQPPVSTGIPPQLPVPSLFTPQPMHTSMGPPPSIPFQPATGPPANAFQRTGAWQPFPAQQPQPGFVQPQPFKPTPQIPSSTILTPSTVTGHLPPPIAMTLPGVSSSGSIFYPQSSVPPSHLAITHPTPRQSALMGQPPTPPSMTASYTQFNYPGGMGFHHGGPGAPANLPPPPTGSLPWLQDRQDAAVEHEGWTDSFSMKAGMQRKKPSAFVPPAPITAPVMSLPSEPDPLQPHLSLDSGQTPPGAPKEASMQALHRLPVEKIEKKELPAEHLPLQRTFNGLVQRCSSVASDPKTKRKLEDASQRLECLYDKLRENTLSPHILAGLHDIAHCVESRNYQQGLIVHTHVVSSSNFSEVSGFMPILKVLMTIASKLGV